jgi:hypothetical protein
MQNPYVLAERSSAAENFATHWRGIKRQNCSPKQREPRQIGPQR